ncbi:unnamed protein product [Orchesella dallaii]|uniref:TNFR-Cys domain-containing protein n=1 Tax=Orchesella dallaii TaxID=48710 RepID=A0ABP1QTB6_9HEXA
MMALRTLLLCGVVWAHVNLASAQNGGLPVAKTAGSTPPVAQPLMKSGQGSSISGCFTDTDCPDNHYCGGRSKTRCVECYDCAKVQRSSKIAYDGKACARQQSDCGECNPGFTEAGGSCLFTNDLQHQIDTQAVEAFNSFHQASEEKIGEVAESAGLSPAVVAILSSVVIVVGLMLIIVGVLSGKANAISTALRPKAGGSPQFREEEAQPFSDSNHWSNQPTAPLQEEYGQQPPYHPNGNNSMPMQNAFNSMERLINEKPQQALPFDRGNGGGDWNITNENDVQIPDETDGIPSIPQQPQSSINNSSSNHNAQAHGSLPRQSIRRSFPPPRNIPAHQPRGNAPGQGISTINPRNNGFQPPPRQNGNHIDAVVGHVRVDFQFGFANYSWQNHPEGPHNPPGMEIASAPNSPRAGRIDDSFVFLSNSPQTFNTSVDSGTGTGDEHDQTVPSSRSVSGNDVSELDVDVNDSMFSDIPASTQSEPHAPRQPPVQNLRVAAAQLEQVMDFAQIVEALDLEDNDRFDMEVEE